MNKIDKKVLGNIELSLSNKNITSLKRDFLHLLKNLIEGKTSKGNIVCMIDQYSSISFVLFDLFHLSFYEIGYIFNKILSFNTSVVEAENSMIVTNGMYNKELQSVGIHNDEEFFWALDCYMADKLMPNYPNAQEVRKVLGMILNREAEQHNFKLKQYQIIRDFMTKDEKNEADYCIACNALQKINCTDILIDSFVAFHKVSKEKKTTVNSGEMKITVFRKEDDKPECSFSKKYIKTRLKELQEQPFDFIQFQDTLSLLQYSNYADDVKIKYLNQMIQNTLKNYSYYRYVIDKTTYMKRDKKIIQEINDIFASMFICSSEDYEFYKNYAIELISKLEYNVIDNFDYELQLMKKH